MMDSRSLRNLSGVHTDLALVIQKAFESIASDSHITFKVTEGVRTMQRQKELYAAKKTKTLKTRHITENNECEQSCAVDVVAIVDGQVSWDFIHYLTLSKYIKAAAEVLHVPIVWGGDWKSFKDGPHFQLSEVAYPMKK